MKENSSVLTSDNSRHNRIISYIKNGSTIFNTVFLILHICFGIFFSNCGATILFNYNIISILTYLIAYVLLYFSLSELYSLIVNLEVYVFMVMSAVCLGWEYGFQQYCIIFVVSLLFTDYTVNQEHKIKKATIASIALTLVTYFAIRIWTYYNPHVYYLEDKTPERILYLLNNVIAFGFVLAYSLLYSQTVLRLEQTLVDVATKDALTGLYNRRKMQDLLNAMSELLTNAGSHMCIAMIDIDNFKRVNDTYGHDAGDEVLKKVADILLEKSLSKEGFYSCRWGGEEFLVFCRTDFLTNEEFIREFDSIRQQIADTTVVYGDHEIHFTITTGLAFYHENLSVSQLIKLADDNLYVGKNNGKNVVKY